MKVTIDIPTVRVIESNDVKGNPVWYLEIFGAPALFALPTGPYNDPKVGGLDSKVWGDIFKDQVADMLGMMLITTYSPEGWTKESPTGREVHLIDVGED